MKKILALFLIFGASASAQPSFDAWLANFKAKAYQSIPKAKVDAALKNTKHLSEIVQLDKKQPEFIKSFWKYYSSALTPTRIAKGRELMQTHSVELERVGRKYGVQPHVLLAFWGMETNFGTHFGGFSLTSALATLAYDDRRSAFFTRELMSAIRIISDGHIPNTAQSSWAGAFGNFQFMPTTFEKYARDGDGDGKIDLYGNFSDSLESAANYLHEMGWREKEKWGRPVRMSRDTAELWAQVNNYEEHTVAEFAALGLVGYDGASLPPSTTRAMLVAPNGVSAPMFLIYENFNYIMKWNASQSYAISVGLLSDEIAGRGTELSKPQETGEQPLSLDEIREIQSALQSLNLYGSNIDGRLGRATIKAIKAYQTALLGGDPLVSDNGVIVLTYDDGSPVFPDGYPSRSLHTMLRKIKSN